MSYANARRQLTHQAGYFATVRHARKSTEARQFAALVPNDGSGRMTGRLHHESIFQKTPAKAKLLDEVKPVVIRFIKPMAGRQWQQVGADYVHDNGAESLLIGQFDGQK